MDEWSWVPQRRWRARAQAVGLTVQEYLAWPQYLSLDQVLVLVEGDVSLFEYRRRVRALAKAVRARGGDDYSVRDARRLVVTAASCGVPFAQVVDMIVACPVASVVETALRADVPVWFANYTEYAVDAPARPAQIRGLYRRLVSYRHSSPELVRVVAEGTGSHVEARGWARASAGNAEAVALALEAGITLAEAEGNRRLLEDVDALRTLVALTGSVFRMRLLAA